MIPLWCRRTSQILWPCMVAVGAACAPTPREPPPPPAPSGIQHRHFDQVCSSPEKVPTDLRLEELFDTTGLSEELARVGVQPLPLVPPWPIYEFITRYGADGRPVDMGTWEATVDSAVAAGLEDSLRARVRRLPRLLQASSYRTRVTFARRVTIALARPVTCMPHMAHPPGGRPYGLERNVTTWGAMGRSRSVDDRTAIVRITVAPDGRVVSVEGLSGAPGMVDRARAQVAHLRFDPALRNGLPVEGALVQGFRFRPTTP